MLRKGKLCPERAVFSLPAAEEPKKVPLIIIISLVVLLIVFLAILCYNIFFKDPGSSSFNVTYAEESVYEDC